MKEFTTRLRQKEDRVVTESLRASGIDVDSVFDLVNDGKSHPDAVEPLLQALSQVTDAWIKQGIVRALTDRAARGVAARPLMQELRRAADFGEESLAWAIGNALTVVADESILDELLDVAADERFGIARQTIALTLGRFKQDERVVRTLIELLDDDQIAAHALTSLRKLKAAQAAPRARALTAHKNRLIRREAEKTLKALDAL